MGHLYTTSFREIRQHEGTICGDSSECSLPPCSNIPQIEAIPAKRAAKSQPMALTCTCEKMILIVDVFEIPGPEISTEIPESAGVDTRRRAEINEKRHSPVMAWPLGSEDFFGAQHVNDRQWWSISKSSARGIKDQTTYQKMWKSSRKMMKYVCCKPVPTKLDPAAMRVVSQSILGFHQVSWKNLLQLACYQVPSSKTENIKHIEPIQSWNTESV